MRLNGKKVDLNQLEADLTARGITVRALGTAGDEIHTYDNKGAPVDLPAEAATVIAAHMPRVEPDPDAELAAAISAANTLAELKAALLGAIRRGRVAGRGV